VPFDTRTKLEEKRLEDNPEDYAPDDPMRPETFRKADWPGLVELATETLAQKSKDLLVAARLTEALVKQHGFAGLRDGLHLLRELVEQRWDHLHPVIEDSDLEIRAGPFYWLDAPDRGARLPTTLRLVPLVWRTEGTQEFRYGRFHWANDSKDPRDRVPKEDFEKAILATPVEHCEAVAAEIAQSQEELGQLVRSLDAKMGPVAPALNGIRSAVEDCHGLVQQILKRKRPASSPKSDMLDEQAAPAPAAAGSGRAAATRADAYQQLAQAAALLQELEPHSPIPYLVQRAVELGGLPFPQLIKALIRDANVLAELNRELGIKEPPADGQGVSE
jgi:type VI secretion system protein ImpA